MSERKDERFCVEYGPEIADGMARWYLCCYPCRRVGRCYVTEER